MSAASIRARNRLADGQARCQIAVQALVRGYQDLRVTGQSAQASGRGHGVVTVRVGLVLLELHDREAMYSWVAAIQRAIEVQDAAFGPELPPSRVGPRRPERIAS